MVVNVIRCILWVGVHFMDKGGGRCDWDSANEFKHFRIFEKLMNSEILENFLRLMNSF